MSKFIADGNNNAKSRLIKALGQGIESLSSYETKPKGVFGREAKIKCGNVTIKSSDLDFVFDVSFDDDMVANEAEITIYNLSDNTVNQLKKDSAISIEAGYTGDTGVIFSGFITRPHTKYVGADRVTTLKCKDDIKDHTITEITYAAGKTSEYILKDLLTKTGIPIEVFKMRKVITFEDEQKVDGDLMENIKKYSDICGVSSYVSNGKIYSRYIKEGDNSNFVLSEETGLIGSPEEYEEEKTFGEDKETIKGYECEMLLQHRITRAAIVKLKSRDVNGEYRVCSGTHSFSENESITRIKMY